MIYLDDAIDAIRKDMYADKDYMSAIICDGIENVLKALPSAQPRWIPCSEKLPEERTKVLATVLVPHRESIVISAEYLMSTFYCDNGDCWMADDEEVVAWMPLPTPYNGGQDE